jgi:hypothetical protein
VEQTARQRVVLLSYYLTLNDELPNSKSVFHHFSITDSSTAMSPDSEVGGNDSEDREKTLRMAG